MSHLCSKFKQRTLIHHCQLRKFGKRRLMRGVLPWNKWQQTTFREAIYKYVTDKDYQNLRKKHQFQQIENVQKEEHHNQAQGSMDMNQSHIPHSRYMQMQSNSDSNMKIITDSNSKFDEKKVIFTNDKLYEDEFKPNYKQKDVYNNRRSRDAYGMDANSYVNTYKIDEKMNSNMNNFASDLWTKYAYKTFIIDRTKLGNLPIYNRFARHRQTSYVEIRKIRGSKDDFLRCLRAYMGKDCDITETESAVRVWGKNYLNQVSHFLLKMGF